MSTNKRIAVFPGSFDPFTVGHEALVKRTLSLFDQVIIAVGMNANKKYMFTKEKRTEWIKNVFANEPKVRVTSFTGLIFAKRTKLILLFGVCAPVTILNLKKPLHK